MHLIKVCISGRNIVKQRDGLPFLGWVCGCVRQMYCTCISRNFCKKKIWKFWRIVKLKITNILYI